MVETSGRGAHRKKWILSADSRKYSSVWRISCFVEKTESSLGDQPSISWSIRPICQAVMDNRETVVRSGGRREEGEEERDRCRRGVGEQMREDGRGLDPYGRR